jgi:hypothetical protein
MQAGRGEWWQARWFAVVAVVATCLPLAWPAFPPLTDVLGHAGRYRVMLDGGVGPLAQWYAIIWRPVGNLGADLLVAVLGPLLGLEPAVKLVVVATIATSASGVLALSRAAHGRMTPTAIVALPLLYNHPFHTGFLNFALAMALALHAAAFWLRSDGWRWRAVAVVPIALLVWTTHIFGWAVLCLMLFAAETVRRPLHCAALACWPLAAPLPLMLWWRAGAGGATIGFLDIQGKALALLMAFRDRWFALDVVTLAIALLFLSLGLRRSGSDPRLARGDLLLLAALILLPGWLMGSAFADMRLAPWVVIVALLAVRPGPSDRPLALAAVAFAAARIAATTASLLLSSERIERETATLTGVPNGARIALLVTPDCADRWTMTRLDHIGGLATVRRGAFVNDQWPDVGAALLHTRYPAAGAFQNDPSQLLPCDGGATRARRIAALPRGAFDYLWLVDAEGPLPEHMSAPVWRAGPSALYRLD